MEKPNKGIKRHEALFPLSHHHHHALFMALKFKKAGTEKSKNSPEELKEELKQFWDINGNQHFRDEEEILLPIYAKYGSLEKQEITEMLLEHVQIRSYVHQILHTDENLVTLMNQLGQLLDDHIRKEERIIFPMIEKALPEEELVKLKPYLHVDEIKPK
jgi:iron-sulfur cluster repair protein YtfE (RIC family)